LISFPSLPPLDFIPDTAADTIARKKRYLAEEFWLQQQGVIYIQHSRKAGGTTLCMTLRSNMQGLIHDETKQPDTNPKWETCQIRSFCSDCNLQQVERTHNNIALQLFDSFETYPRLLSCVLTLAERNFFEMEGTVSPPDILTNPEWSHYVFVSTIRDPISRIKSSLRNDPKFNMKGEKRSKDFVENCTIPHQPSKADTINSCAQRHIFTDKIILNNCDGSSIYHCYSNYYVRMYAGTVTTENPKVTHSTLEQAKRNFERYSCVVLNEAWDLTAECLPKRLGLQLRQRSLFNVNGRKDIRLDRNTKTETVTTIVVPNVLNSTYLKTFSEIEFERLIRLNKLDIEFFEWAKQRILTQANYDFDRKAIY